MILKWLILAAIVAGVWYGFKIIIRRNKARQIAAGRRRTGSVEDLRACRVCGSYVAEGQQGCGRDDCPYPN